jgi:hypothetical protein
MGIKRHSIQTLAAKGFIPSVIYAAQNPNRIVNPLWNFTLPYTFQGTVAGYTSGGFGLGAYTSQNIIDKFPFASDANATDVGDLTALTSKTAAGQSSSTHGYVSGGGRNPGGYSYDNGIDKFPFATNANATDVGNLTVGRRRVAGQSSTVSGYTTGGELPSAYSNVIDKFPFASDGNATDVGDLTVTRQGPAGQSSDVSGYSSGGSASVNYNVIDKFPFASDGNATDVGDLTSTRSLDAGQSSTLSGYSSGGMQPTISGPNFIDKFPFATNANATDVGNLTVGRNTVAGQSSTVSGYSSGGYGTPEYLQVNIIDKFPFTSDANATDVGDLTVARRQVSGQQD